MGAAVSSVIVDVSGSGWRVLDIGEWMCFVKRMEVAVSVAQVSGATVEVAVRQDDSEIQKEPDVLFC